MSKIRNVVVFYHCVIVKKNKPVAFGFSYAAIASKGQTLLCFNEIVIVGGRIVGCKSCTFRCGGVGRVVVDEYDFPIRLRGVVCQSAKALVDVFLAIIGADDEGYGHSMYLVCQAVRCG